MTLAGHLLKAIAEHEWSFEYTKGQLDGLVCTCGWATSATDRAITRWGRHRDRRIRDALAQFPELDGGAR